MSQQADAYAAQGQAYGALAQSFADDSKALVDQANAFIARANELFAQAGDLAAQADTDVVQAGIALTTQISAWFDYLDNLPPLPGDANLDGVVDGLDLDIWQSHVFSTQATFSMGDFDGNGVRDEYPPGSGTLEPGLGGVTIFVDLNENGELDDDIPDPEPSTVTASDGTYCLSDLTSGTYRICEVEPDGYVQTYPYPDDCHVVSFAGGAAGPFDFGNAETGEIKSLKWEDSLAPFGYPGPSGGELAWPASSSTLTRMTTGCTIPGMSHTISVRRMAISLPMSESGPGTSVRVTTWAGLRRAQALPAITGQ